MARIKLAFVISDGLDICIQRVALDDASNAITVELFIDGRLVVLVVDGLAATEDASSKASALKGCRRTGSS